MVEHRSVVNLVRSLLRDGTFTSSDVALVLTTLSFDVAGAEIYAPLAAGGRLVIATDDHGRDPVLLASVIARFGVTVAGATPATWRMLTSDGWRPSASMRIHTAGEAIGRDLADRVLEGGARLTNLYGPTETTIYSTATELRPGQQITIGRPLDNTRTYVLDAQLEPVPVGVLGELCIGGAGVARGYLGRPDLTAEKFVADPFSNEPGARTYRTGDMARWRSDGTLDYVGRRDGHVKLRGFRIELGEIEAALRSAAGIREAVVVLREDVPGDARLVAYVITRNGVELDTSTLREHLLASLPEYMVPTAFVRLEVFPKNANGKLDQRALPAPDMTSRVAYVAPRTPIEESIAAIFGDVLGLERVGVNDDFFKLGGHSLLAARVTTRVRQLMAIDLAVRAVFEARTTTALASMIDARNRTHDSGEI
jgi:acyl-coenzyme A synthetase/AMP-(fatty) acid ligase